MTFNGDTTVDIVKNENNIIPDCYLKEFEDNGGQFFSMNTLDIDYNTNATKIKFKNDETKYYVAKIDYGEIAGYHRIPLVYNNSLTSISISSIIGFNEPLTMPDTFAYLD